MLNTINNIINCMEVGEGYWEFTIKNRVVCRIFYVARNNIEKARFINEEVRHLFKIYNIKQ